MDAEMMRRLAALSGPERAKLMGKLRRATGVAERPGARLERRDDPRPPASFVQQQLWFLHQLAPDQPAYNVSFSFRLLGPLRRDALRTALAGVLERHPVLRARLVLDDGTLRQLPDGVVPLLVEQQVADEAAAAAEVARMSREPFDLGTGPVSRTALLALGPEDHLLVWIAHHTVVDGWSFGLLLDELTAGYRAALDGGVLPVDATRPLYPDVAAWQREREAAGEYTAAVERWRGRLAGVPQVTVPTDLPRPAAQTFAGALERFVVPPPVATALGALAERTGTTLFAVLLAGWQALVARTAGAADLVVGVPLSGRGRPELESVVGPLANTLPVRGRPAPDTPFEELLREVNGAVLDALEDQDVPFGRLVEQLVEGRDPSRNPVFQVLFNLGNLPGRADGGDLAPGVRLRPDAHPNGTVRMDLELTMEQAGGALSGRLEYNTALYRPDTARQLVAELQAVLAAVAADPAAPVRTLPVAPRTAPLAPRTPARPAAPAPTRRSRAGADWFDRL
ncbi:condensation domain-containing protein [Kitasatospora sp. NPDC004531]